MRRSHLEYYCYCYYLRATVVVAAPLDAVATIEQVSAFDEDVETAVAGANSHSRFLAVEHHHHQHQHYQHHYPNYFPYF